MHPPPAYGPIEVRAAAREENPILMTERSTFQSSRGRQTTTTTDMGVERAMPLPYESNRPLREWFPESSIYFCENFALE
jgi:hypothetical protein